jgi:glycosyltransferase involved in cell wall biosynthesis
VIHHGIDASRVPVGAGDGDHLLVLARMDEDKGVHVAVEAARRAGQRLLVAGPVRTERERAYFDQHVRPRLGRGVEYVGEVGGAEKLALLGAAKAVLMPVLWDEPFGLVAVEALAAGTPVLAFARGALTEIVDDGRTGYLCGNAGELAEAIGRIDALDRDACREAAETRFSARRMAEEHLAFYADVTASRLTARAPAHPWPAPARRRAPGAGGRAPGRGRTR